MATRSAIIAKNSDGKYRGIYCHYDGYLSHNGRILHDHYSDPEKVQKLLDLGDIWNLGERLEPTGEHSEQKPEKGVVVAFERDAGGEPSPAREDITVSRLSRQFHVAYVYVFRDGIWYVDSDLLSEALKYKDTE